MVQPLRKVLGKISQKVAITAIALVILGCQTGSERSPSASSATSLGSETSTSTFFIPEGTSDFQSRILADGAVTDAEFAAARQAQVDCMVRLGIKAEVSEGNTGIQYSTKTDEEFEAATQASDQCGIEYSWDVESRYALGHPSGIDPADFYSCLIDAGLLNDSDSDDPLEVQRAAAKDIATAYTCLNDLNG